MNRASKQSMRCVVVIAGVVFSPLLSGCGNYTSTKFDIAASKPNSDIGGIPFTLNKAQPTVARVPGSNGMPDTYSVTWTYVPDPSQRYVISLDPSWTANIDWTVTLDDSGSLGQTNGKVTDQTVAVLTSLAKLAGAAAAAAIPQIEQKRLPPPPQPQTDQSKWVKEIGEILRSNFSRNLLFDEETRTCKLGNVKQLADRWIVLSKLLVRLAAVNGATKFTFKDSTDRVMLETALCSSDPSIPPDPLKTPDSIQHYLTDGDDANLTAFALRINQLIFTFDRKGLASIKSDVIKQANILYAQSTANPYLGSDAGWAKKVAQNDLQIAMINDAIATVSSQRRGFLLDLTEISESEWEGRRISEINEEIQARQFALRANEMSPDNKVPIPDNETNDPTIKALLRQKAGILGLLPVYDQIGVLSAIPPSDTKFKDAQSLLPSLQKQLADAEAGLTTTKASAKADDPVRAELLSVPSGSTYPSTQNSSQWIVEQLKAKNVAIRPSYVIVLEPAPTSSSTSQPTGGH